MATGLDHLTANAYKAADAAYDNWWDGEIGSPQALLDVVALVPLDVTAHVQAQHAGDCIATIALAQPTTGLAVSLDSRTNAGNRPILQVIS